LDDGTVAGQTATADGSGHASFTVSLVEGDNSFSATATDAAGNTSSAGTLSVKLDDIAPTAPVLTLVAADDTGSSNADDLTNKSTVHISVAAEAGSTVHLDDGTVAGQTATADGSGHASFTVSLVEGGNSFSATATDAAGNTSSAGTLSVTLDNIAPATPVLTLVAA